MPLLSHHSYIVRVATLLRPRQWIKNGFLAIPVLLTPTALSLETAVTVLFGMVAFSLTASSIYILNDFMDRAADALHPIKRARPLASGSLSPAVAWVLMGGLLRSGLALGYALSGAFVVILGAYVITNIAYSLGLKHMSIVDILLIAFGFILRIQAGAVLVEVDPTAWILIITGLLAVFLALAKRRDDLVKAMGADHRSSLDGYNQPFLDSMVIIVLGALLVSYLIYTTDAEVIDRVGSDKLFFSAPFVAAGIMRYLQLMLVEERTGDPTMIALTDRFLIGSIAGWAVSLGGVIYV